MITIATLRKRTNNERTSKYSNIKNNKENKNTNNNNDNNNNNKYNLWYFLVVLNQQSVVNSEQFGKTIMIIITTVAKLIYRLNSIEKKKRKIRER